MAKLKETTVRDKISITDSSDNVETEITASAGNLYVSPSGGTPTYLVSTYSSKFKFSRPKFTYVDTNTITIGPGDYYLYNKGWVYWTSDITFNLGSSGSNANSDDLTASEWHHIAIDYSTVSAAGTLTASNFINRRAANVTPTYSGTKGGVYQDTNDRTICAVLTNGSSQVSEFFTEGDQFLSADQIEDLSETDIDTTWTDVTLTAPVFCTRVLVTFQSKQNGDVATGFWRTNGQSGSTGHAFGRGTARDYNSVPVITDSSQIIEVKNSDSNNAQMAVYTNGYFFPAGM